MSLTVFIHRQSPSHYPPPLTPSIPLLPSLPPNPPHPGVESYPTATVIKKKEKEKKEKKKKCDYPTYLPAHLTSYRYPCYPCQGAPLSSLKRAAGMV
ncbi:hypothetical protein L209DRAFT_753420 [Thermothelomyces heterothallicus CBS 203.75]